MAGIAPFLFLLVIFIPISLINQSLYFISNQGEGGAVNASVDVRRVSPIPPITNSLDFNRR
jgi:hypothetical protein